MLLWGGGFLIVLRHHQPEVMTCEAARKRKPPPQWLWLTNCQLDLSDAAAPAAARGRRPDELFVPLRDLDQTGKVGVLLLTKNPIYLATFLQLQSFKSPSDARRWASTHADMVFPRREAKGVVRPVPKSLKLDRQPDNLAAEYLLLEEGVQPGKVRSPAAMTAGAFLAGAGVCFALRRR